MAQISKHREGYSRARLEQSKAESGTAGSGSSWRGGPGQDGALGATEGLTLRQEKQVQQSVLIPER